MAPLLDLTGFAVDSHEQTREEYRILAHPTVASDTCPNCNSPNLVRFGSRPQEFADSPIRGKRAVVVIDRPRYRCKDCGKTHSEPLPHIDVEHNCTERLTAYVREQSLGRPFVQVASECGLNEKTVRNIFGEWVERLNEEHQFTAPAWLGMDELKLVNGMRAIFTDVKERRIVDLLPKRDLRVVARWLSHLQGRDRVEVVTMDMWKPYRDAVRQIMPQAQIVVDKFHVLRMANYCMDLIRKDMRASMKPSARRGLMHDRFLLHRRKRDLDPMQGITVQGWTLSHPQLAHAYEAKEGFYEIWDVARTPDDASTLYAEWLANLPDDIAPAFRVLTTAMDNWHPEIFAYFGIGATNAYTECLNGLVKMLNRAGRGYSFRAIRAKILFAGQRADRWNLQSCDTDNLAAEHAYRLGYSDLSVFLRTMFAMPYSRYEIGF